MNTPIPENKNNRGKYWAARTHRLVAISAMLFLLLLAVTGLVLNHADGLGLSSAYPPRMMQRVLYGADAPPVDSAYVAGDLLFASAAGTLYVDAVALAETGQPLRGAVAVRGGIVLATKTELLLATPRAELVERFTPELTATIDKLGVRGRDAVLSVGQSLFVLDTGQMRLTEAGKSRGESVLWSEPVVVPAARAQQIAAATSSRLFSWERLLLDLHSGRILPGVGTVLADLAALSLIYLCITGLLLWFRRR
jgi:hypothetical protein